MLDIEAHGTEDNLHSRIGEGAISNLASIPWWIRWLIPKVGHDSQGAVVHDDIYKKGYMWRTLNGVTAKEPVFQIDADNAYLIAMEELNVGKLRREAIYRGLRMGGFVAWNKYRTLDTP